MSKREEFTITMKTGEKVQVQGRRLRPHWFCYKESGRYWLTHEPTGAFLTSAPTIKSLQELLNEPEFFGKDIRALEKAVYRWGAKNNWK